MPTHIGTNLPEEPLPLFETNASAYRWLNDIGAAGIGQLTIEGVRYSIHQIL